MFEAIGIYALIVYLALIAAVIIFVVAVVAGYFWFKQKQKG